MTGDKGPSFSPGTYVAADPERTIMPGELVLADLLEDGPVFRIYKAARPYAQGVPFRLVASNPAYDAIDVTEARQLVSIARVIFTAQPW